MKMLPFVPFWIFGSFRRGRPAIPLFVASKKYTVSMGKHHDGFNRTLEVANSPLEDAFSSTSLDYPGTERTTALIQA
jgi:hypothetical protein